MARIRTPLGASVESHSRQAALNAQRAGTKLDRAQAALKAGDCGVAWSELVEAAKDIGSVAAHADSSSRQRTIALVVPENDQWQKLERKLTTLTDAAQLCFRPENKGPTAGQKYGLGAKLGGGAILGFAKRVFSAKPKGFRLRKRR